MIQSISVIGLVFHAVHLMECGNFEPGVLKFSRL